MYELHDSGIIRIIRNGNDFVFYIDPYNIYYPDIKEIRLKFVNARNNIKFSKYLSELDFTDDGRARVECFVISNNKNKFYLSVDGCQEKGIEINCDGIIWEVEK